MAKVRVYELAKELGVESKILLGHLKEQGEFVRSASSTIEPPVVRKIRETFPTQLAEKIGRQGQRGHGRRKKAGTPEAGAALSPGRHPERGRSGTLWMFLWLRPPIAPVVRPVQCAFALVMPVTTQAPSHPVVDAPAAVTPEAPAAREGGGDTHRPAPRPGAPQARQQPVRAEPGHASR